MSRQKNYRIPAAMASLALVGGCLAAPVTASAGIFDSVAPIDPDAPSISIDIPAGEDVLGGLEGAWGGLGILDGDGSVAMPDFSHGFDAQGMIQRFMEKTGLDKVLAALFAHVETYLDEHVDVVENSMIAVPTAQSIAAVDDWTSSIGFGGLRFVLPEGYIQASIDEDGIANGDLELCELLEEMVAEEPSLAGSPIMACVNESGTVVLVLADVSYDEVSDEADEGMDELYGSPATLINVTDLCGVDISAGTALLADSSTAFVMGMCAPADGDELSRVLALVVPSDRPAAMTAFALLTAGDLAAVDAEDVQSIMSSLGANYAATLFYEDDDVNAYMYGRTLLVELPSAGATGYAWTVADGCDLEFESWTEETGEEGLAGGPVKTCFLFSLPAECSGQVEFQLSRPWEEGEEPAQTVVLDYEVSVSEEFTTISFTE